MADLTTISTQVLNLQVIIQKKSVIFHVLSNIYVLVL
jgi:hypothetical protein